MAAMNSIAYSFLWKEWREHRWKLALLSAAYVVTIFVAGFAAQDTLFGAASVTFTLIVPLASMFVAMGIAAGEQGRGTIGFLLALPTPMRRAAAAKLAMALVTVIAPPLAAVGATYLCSRVMPPAVVEELLRYDLQMYGTWWGLDDWYLARALAVAAGSASVLIWMAAAGVNRSDEVRAGAVGLLVVMAAWAVVVLAGARLRHEGNLPAWWNAVEAASPGGVSTVGNRVRTEDATDWRRYAGEIVATAVAVHLALAAWYILRFGRTPPARANPAEQRLPAVEQNSYLAPPRRGPVTAIVWKQLRESAPLALLGAGLTIAATAVVGGYQYATSGVDVDGVAIVATVTGWAWVGLFVSLVAGIGLFMDDLQPRLNAFWRSRPIDVDRWFMVKFAVGAVATLAILAAPPLVTLAAARLAGLQMEDHERMMAELRRFAPTMLSVQFELFCLAAMAIVLTRQAIYAAMLAIAAAAVAMASGARLDPLGDRDVLWTAWAAAAAATVLAWTALRRDWGWKH